ncbi:MAG: glycosyltransferase family 4 protein [Vicinamibacterales bacterium]
MINVLHLRDTDRVCGPGKTILETACAANPREFHHAVGLFLLHAERSNAYVQALEERGVDVVPIRSPHQFDPRIVRTIIRIVKERRIDIIHSHEYKSDLLAWAVSRVHRVPIMSTVHGWIRHNLKTRLYIRAGQMVLDRFDRVVAVSEQTRAAVIACGVPEDKVVVIHNAIVTENYRPEDQAPGFLRHRYRLPRDARLVGYVGRLSPEKGQRDLLIAAAEVLRAHRDVWFVLVGDGPDRDTLARQARDTGIEDRVLFTGHLADVRPVFRDLDIVALTSHTEGFPNVILEALCMKTPVIATDVGGVREIVTDGVTGLLVPSHAPTRIAAGLCALLERPQWAAELAMAGHDAVHRRFTFQHRVAREEAVCREILASWKH